MEILTLLDPTRPTSVGITLLHSSSRKISNSNKLDIRWKGWPHSILQSTWHCDTVTHTGYAKLTFAVCRQFFRTDLSLLIGLSHQQVCFLVEHNLLSDLPLQLTSSCQPKYYFYISPPALLLLVNLKVFRGRNVGTLSVWINNQSAFPPSGLGKTKTLIRFEENCPSWTLNLAPTIRWLDWWSVLPPPQSKCNNCKFANMYIN